jgi:hypothetical protein
MMVSQWITWYKRYRAILESDLIHGRRADGRDIDWMLHVNSGLQTRGMLVVFNPLDEPVTRTLSVPLYYTGLTETALVRREENAPKQMPLAADRTMRLDVSVPAGGMTWYVIEGER